MTDLSVPTAFQLSLTDGVQRRPSMQGQDVVPIVDRDNAPGSPLCQVAILMDPRKVSTPHVHETAHVYVHLVHSYDHGVLTLFGENLDREVWLYPGGTLWIPPGVPHVAVYPAPDPEVHAQVTPVTVLAIETRSVDHWTSDVVALPKLWSTLRRQLEYRGMMDFVDYPPDQVTGHLSGTGQDSCFPTSPRR